MGIGGPVEEDSPRRFARDLRELRGSRSFRDLERRNERMLDGAGRRSKSTLAAAEQSVDGAGRPRVAPPDTVLAFVLGCGLDEAAAREWVRRGEHLRDRARQGHRQEEVRVAAEPASVALVSTEADHDNDDAAGAGTSPAAEPSDGAESPEPVLGTDARVDAGTRIRRWWWAAAALAVVASVVVVLVVVGSARIEPALSGPRPGGDCAGEEVFSAPDGANATLTRVFVDRASGVSCALLTKQVDLGQETYLAIELCNSTGRCDRDMYRYPRGAGPVRVDTEGSCLTVRVSALTPDDVEWLVPETEYRAVGC